MISLPEEIKEIRQWTYSYSLDELKRPTHYKYAPNGAFDFQTASDRAGAKKLIGFLKTLTVPKKWGF